MRNKGSLKNVKLFAEARCGSLEEKRDFVLRDSMEPIFRLPDLNGGEKIYYGIYFASGKALYLNSFSLLETENPRNPINIIEARCDRDSYVNAEGVSVSWKLNSPGAITLRLIADLIGPDSSSAQIIDEDIDLEEGINILDRDRRLEFTGEGLYRIIYRFLDKDSALAQGSLFFDVGGEVRLTLRPDKRDYLQGDIIKLTARCFSSFDLKGSLKLFLDGGLVETRDLDIDGYKEFDFDIRISQIGSHRVHCSLVYDNKRIDSDGESLNILAKPNHSPVLFTIGEKKVVAGEALECFIKAKDIDGDRLFYSVAALPEGALFDVETGRFFWRPGYQQIGGHIVTFMANDGKDVALEKVKIIVTGYIPPQKPRPLAEPQKGMAPLEVNFSAEGIDREGRFVKYEWDFDGKGVYDYASLESGEAVFVYIEEGSFPAALRVTDSQGNTYEHKVSIDVTGNPDAPLAFLETAPLKGTAPCKVYFKGKAVSSSEICRYEWDFDGDGVYDASSTQSGDIVKTYTLPGRYKAGFKVTNSMGLSSSQDVLLEISSPEALDIEALISDYNGNAPVEIGFDASIDSLDPIQKYQWDFDGDGVFDFTSTDSPLASHKYYDPGLYRVTLRVTDAQNISSESRKEIRLGVFNIKGMKKGRMTVDVRKGKAPISVNFSLELGFGVTGVEYFWDFDGDHVCDLVSSLPEAGYTYYDSGVYTAEVNAKVGRHVVASCRETVYITNGKRDNRVSRPLDKFSLKKRQDVRKDKMNRIELSDRTSLVLPAGVLDRDDVVNIEKLRRDGVFKEIDVKEDIVPIGEYREYRFNNRNRTFTREMTISIPYVDEDDNGLVDEEDIDELTQIGRAHV